MFMNQRLQNATQTGWSIILRITIILAIIYVVFGISKSIWKNWQMVENIKKAQDNLTALQNKNTNLQNLLLYYKTDTFKELEARRQLGLKKPGESVIVIPENSDDKKTSESSADQNNTNQEEKQNSSNLEKWWHFVIK